MAKERKGARSSPGSSPGSGQADGIEALDASPIHLLHRALQVALDLYAEETAREPALEPQLTQRQYAVLVAAGSADGLNQTDLVRLTGIDRSTLADLVARLISRDLLARERSNVDARANTVRLTESGRAALESTKARISTVDARLLALLPKSRREGFTATLLALAAGSGKAEKAREEKARRKAEKQALKAARKAGEKSGVKSGEKTGGKPGGKARKAKGKKVQA